MMQAFEKLELDGDEIFSLFDVLCADDGVADYEEFLSGALKMKSSARTIDALQIQHGQLAMARDVKKVHELLVELVFEHNKSVSRQRSGKSTALA